MKKRFVQLNSSEILTLKEGRNHHPQFQFRNRSHCLLLSSQGHDITSLMHIFNVSRITIYNCGAARAVKSLGHSRINGSL